MKAFQLKMMIKNSKPPIWRRIVVPSGITFSQLSMILNEAMGWCGYHMFEFEFFHMNLRISEGMDEFVSAYSMFDEIEASTTYISEYLEENEWFTYTYDLGDDWEHRVTIEKVIDDYEYNYPMVIKYKGDCPVEDCGGIYGYYRCLDIINDKTHPEHEEISEWMNRQMYPSEYDMDYVNDELKCKYTYKWGKGEKRCQSEIYEDMFSGKYGLRATMNDKNKYMAEKKSQLQLKESDQLVESYDKFQRVINRLDEISKYEEILNTMIANMTLVDIFSDFNKDIIYEIAKEKGLKGVSSYGKKKLISCLTTYMLQPEIAREYFIWLNDEEIKEFEKAGNIKGLYYADDYDNLLRLYEAGYIGMVDGGEVTIPKDVYELYQAMKTQEFEEERKKKSYLYSCLKAISSLYAIAPMSVLLQLIEKNKKINMSESEIIAAIYSIPVEYNEWIFISGVIYNKEYYPDDFGLLRAQGDKAFYIPSLNEIISYGKKGYRKDSTECAKLKSFMMTKMDASSELADLACAMMQQRISVECSMQEILNVIDDVNLYIKKQSQINELIECIIELQYSTRKVVNRGYTQNELSKNEAKNRKVISFEQAKKEKIYPNAPCPCGSGKKYKNCCRNK